MPATAATAAAEPAPALTASPVEAASPLTEHAALYNHIHLDALNAMSTDEHWTSRARALEIVKMRLIQSHMQTQSQTLTHAQTAAVHDEYWVPANLLSAACITSYVDMGISHVGDTHQRVAVSALACLKAIVEYRSDMALPKLAQLLVALFLRLSDIRPPVRDSANSLLNGIRLAYEPVSVVAALVPRILDIPERIRTAVVQFLAVTVPHCGSFFAHPPNTWAFLGRMSNVLGAGGSKPTTALLAAARRLLELTYNAAPTVVCSQLAALPLQQQRCVPCAMCLVLCAL
jgi:hypothetical protein